MDEVFRRCGKSDEYANSAEIWYSMVGSFKFSKSDFDIDCHVSKGKAFTGGKARREVGEAEVELELEAREKEKRHAHAHQHGGQLNHIHRLKTRDMMELVP